MTVEKIEELQRIESQIKELKTIAEMIKDEIKEEMGNEEHVSVGGYNVNYTITITTKLNTTQLKKEMPTIYEKFLKEDISRRFSVTMPTKKQATGKGKQ